MKNLKLLFILIYLLLFTLLSSFIVFSNFLYPSKSLNKIKNQQGILVCGSYNFSDSEILTRKTGKKLFYSNCASCHNKNMKSELTGPPLRDSFNRFNRNTANYKFYLTDQKNYLISSKDKRLHTLHKEYGIQYYHNFDFFTKADVQAILFYIKN